MNQPTPTTETKEEIPTHWPPAVHLYRGPGVVRPGLPGLRAVCGARLMGIEFPKGSLTCEKCKALARRGET